MDKHDLKTSILKELNEIGVFPVENTTADLTLDVEFVDAKWGTGEKKIEFHSSAYFDEANRVLYYWESTVDRSSGFSFGGESETSFQTGMTLMRKVKSIQFGPDGKAVEYSLDLGQITKTYKDAAKKANWKFKVVLSKEKAMFPEGMHSGASPIQTMDSESLAFSDTQPVQEPQVILNRTAEMKAEKEGKLVKKPKWFWVPMAITVLLFLLFFGVSSVSMVGWVLGVAAIAGAFTLQKKFSSKGCFIAIALWIFTIVILVFILAFTAK